MPHRLLYRTSSALRGRSPFPLPVLRRRRRHIALAVGGVFFVSLFLSLVPKDQAFSPTEHPEQHPAYSIVAAYCKPQSCFSEPAEALFHAGDGTLISRPRTQAVFINTQALFWIWVVYILKRRRRILLI